MLCKNISKTQLLLVIYSICVIIFEYIYILIKWSDVPEKIPSHYNFNGKCDRYSGKKVLYVIPSVSFGIVLFSFLFCLIPDKYLRVSFQHTPEQKKEAIFWTKWFIMIVQFYVITSLAYLNVKMIYSERVNLYLVIMFVIGIISLFSVYMLKVVTIMIHKEVPTRNSEFSV